MAHCLFGPQKRQSLIKQINVRYTLIAKEINQGTPLCELQNDIHDVFSLLIGGIHTDWRGPIETFLLRANAVYKGPLNEDDLLEIVEPILTELTSLFGKVPLNETLNFYRDVMERCKKKFRSSVNNQRKYLWRLKHCELYATIESVLS